MSWKAPWVDWNHLEEYGTSFSACQTLRNWDVQGIFAGELRSIMSSHAVDMYNVIVVWNRFLQGPTSRFPWFISHSTFTSPAFLYYLTLELSCALRHPCLEVCVKGVKDIHIKWYRWEGCACINFVLSACTDRCHLWCTYRSSLAVATV